MRSSSGRKLSLLLAAVSALSLMGLAAGCSDDTLAAGAGGQTASSTSVGGSGQTTNSSSAANGSTSSASTGAGGAAASCTGKTGPAGDMEFTLDFGGDMRTYRVHAPPGYDPSVPTPVVLVLHGYTETSAQIETITQMTPETDARGMIVVYPQGRSTSWNAGNCCGSSQTLGVDDVGFMSAMLDAIDDAYCTDAKRVFAAGFSNGAMLSNRLACELSDRIAAIGPIAGPLAFDGCAPPRAVPVMEFHGTADFVVPYYGGPLSTAQSVPDAILFWQTHNGCDPTPTTTFDMGDASCETYAGCTDNATVTLCTLQNGGHQWPGGQSAGPGGIINMDIVASSALLDFFAQHPLP